MLQRPAKPIINANQTTEDEGAAISLRQHFGSYEDIAKCIDYHLLRQTISALGMSLSADCDHNELIETYLTNSTLAAISPNLYFDEQWYRLYNADVLAAIDAGYVYSGFVHYVMFGIFEGRWPNPGLHSFRQDAGNIPAATDDIDAALYISAHDGARIFLNHFPIISPLQHYNLFGRMLGFKMQKNCSQNVLPNTSHFDKIAAEFDANYYRNKYLTGDISPRYFNDPFSHYLIYGIAKAYSPNAYFDEAWYRAFYSEVRIAIESGEILSGFYHYIAAGRDEGRLPRFERKGALEARISGVTSPSLMYRIPEIRNRLLQHKRVVTQDTAPRLWFLIPTINPDITFGGYRSAFELMNAAHNAGYDIGLMCTEDVHADMEYFLWRETSETFRKLFQKIPFVNQARESEINIGTKDTLIIYTVWDLYAAEHIRKFAPDIKVVLLAQEYEPIFHDNSSTRAILEEAYKIPHFPLINSALLCKYMKAREIGIFSTPGGGIEGKDYAVFEHRINLLPSQKIAETRKRKDRVLVAYARPEGHAARNMFEVLVLALQAVCEEGLFGPEWSFIGLGALTEIDPIPLCNGHSLQIRPKMSEEEYTNCIACMDIGVSLMFAPHPSVMPFEFATTGAIVVTNTYENRSAPDLAAICPNIIAGPPSLAGITFALRDALRLVDDVGKRVRQRYKPQNKSWSTIFHPALLNNVFGQPHLTCEIDMQMTHEVGTPL